MKRRACSDEKQHKKARHDDHDKTYQKYLDGDNIMMFDITRKHCCSFTSIIFHASRDENRLVASTSSDVGYLYRVPSVSLLKSKEITKTITTMIIDGAEMLDMADFRFIHKLTKRLKCQLIIRGFFHVYPTHPWPNSMLMNEMFPNPSDYVVGVDTCMKRSPAMASIVKAVACGNVGPNVRRSIMSKICTQMPDQHGPILTSSKMEANCINKKHISELTGQKVSSSALFSKSTGYTMRRIMFDHFMVLPRITIAPGMVVIFTSQCGTIRPGDRATIVKSIDSDTVEVTPHGHKNNTRIPKQSFGIRTTTMTQFPFIPGYAIHIHSIARNVLLTSAVFNTTKNQVSVEEMYIIFSCLRDINKLCIGRFDASQLSLNKQLSYICKEMLK